LCPTLGNLDEIELTAVYGMHQADKTNSDVKGLGIHNQPNLTFFPKRMENFFPGLIAFNFGNTRISTLNGDELNPFPNFIEFQISSNPVLERIPGNLFSQTKNLTGVYLRNNNIKHVGEGLLNGLNLTHTYFQNNYCINQNAFNTTQLAALIETLNNNCTDSETTTTTTSFWTQPTTPEPSCGDTNEVVCNIQDQNVNLELKVDQLVQDNEELKTDVLRLVTKNEQLAADNEELKLKVENLTNDVENLQTEMNEKFEQVLEGILELSTRPCGA
jgi:hypothetical protein